MPGVLVVGLGFSGSGGGGAGPSLKSLKAGNCGFNASDLGTQRLL